MEPPAWLAPEPDWDAADVLACKNGLVHLPSLVAGKAHRIGPTPLFFSRNALDYGFDLNAPAPTAWLDFLANVWPKDKESIQALQEWFGYCLLPDTRQHKILMIVGPKRSGKGTIARVLGRVIGMANVCGPTLSSLGMNFGLWPLLGKTLAIISDARLGKRTDIAVVTERLLSISGEDAQTIDRKNLSQVTCKLAVRFMILTNELPHLNDPSGALVGRLVLLRMIKSWYGREDTGLTTQLLAELPSILLWSIRGWEACTSGGVSCNPAVPSPWSATWKTCRRRWAPSCATIASSASTNPSRCRSCTASGSCGARGRVGRGRGPNKPSAATCGRSWQAWMSLSHATPGIQRAAFGSTTASG